MNTVLFYNYVYIALWVILGGIAIILYKISNKH